MKNHIANLLAFIRYMRYELIQAVCFVIAGFGFILLYLE